MPDGNLKPAMPGGNPKPAMPGGNPKPAISLEAELFGARPHPAAAPELAATLELYKVYVSSMEALVLRRQSVNTFFPLILRFGGLA
jgi:hypothetical protein